jgi:hypothetical protein
VQIPVSGHEIKFENPTLLNNIQEPLLIDPRALVKIDTMLKMYPRATENRLHGSDLSTLGPRRAFLRAASINFLILQLLFLGLFAYIFGSLFQQDTHTHNMKIVYVDYDGGVIGASIRAGYKTLEGVNFPTLVEETSAEYASPHDLENAVCSAQYWAALYSSPGASEKLEVALAGGSAATTYNSSDVLTCIWNEARYSAIADSSILVNLQTLSSAARLAYTATNGTGALQILSSTDQAAISVFANPWQLASVNIQPTTQGSRLIYNTLVIILILMQEFFYLGTINGLYVQFKLYARLYPHRIIIFRNMTSLAYTFMGSLCTTGAIWAFRSGWNVDANQFALSWAVLWLFAHGNFLWLDVFTVWLPVQYVPMALVTGVVFNVTSILIPFELSPAFYRWAYAMPAHEVYQVLIDIWSRGCNPQLSYALPILFALELIGLVLSGLGVYRRCHYAIIAEEAQEQAFRERLDAAIAFERKRDKERMGIPETPEATERAETTEREELAEVIRDEDDQIARENTRASRICNFGPSFDLAYRSDS